MTPQEIASRLTAIHTALVEKTGEQPFLSPDVRIDQQGKCSIGLHRAYTVGSYTIAYAKGDTVEACLDDADRIIAALPDPEEAAKRGWQKKLGAVIDEGHALNLPDEVMKPLGAASQAMTENLITKEAAE